jgi:structural maintenance of chromosome 4
LLFDMACLTDVQSLNGRGEALRAKVSNSRHKVDEAKSSLAADKSENAVLASLNKLKAQGRIKGFHVCHLYRVI